LVADIRDDVLAGNQEGMNWSVGKIKNIPAGARFFMIRLGVPPKGIVGAGMIVAAPEEREHYDPDLAAQGRKLNFVDLQFESLAITPVISWDELHRGILADFPWSIRQSGPHLPDEIAAELERLWRERAGIPPPPTPLEVEGQGYFEGAVRQVSVNRRAACLAHYGYNCQLCEVNPSVIYGPEAADLIEVHHVVPLSEIRQGYVPDPINDLIPVCPNCHAMIHHGGITRTIEAVQALLMEADVAREAEQTEPQSESSGDN
jgi:5-methylcytosine-specific restriction protein A